MPVVHPLLNSTWTGPIVVVTVSLIIALVTWALKLMQSAADQQEFSLMLAGCMVCSAAVGLATVLVIQGGSGV